MKKTIEEQINENIVDEQKLLMIKENRIKHNLPLDDEPKFSSGRIIKLGDSIIFGMLLNEKNMEVISFHKDELDVLYKFKEQKEFPLIEKI